MRGTDIDQLAEQWQLWRAGTLYKQKPDWVRRFLLRRFFYRLGRVDAADLSKALGRRESGDTHAVPALASKPSLDAVH